MCVYIYIFDASHPPKGMLILFFSLSLGRVTQHALSRQVCLMRWSARSSSWMWFALLLPWLRVGSFINGKPPWPYWKLGDAMTIFQPFFGAHDFQTNHRKAMVFVLKSSHAFKNKASEVSFCNIAGGLRNVFFLGPTQSLMFFLGFLGWFCGH